jgi:protein-S-isoprenylcysteine O-methyltransferase Ste14
MYASCAGILLIAMLVSVDPDVVSWALWTVATVVFSLGVGLKICCLIGNEFLEPTVRIQNNNDHRVVDTGPYSLVRHPYYTSYISILIATPLMIGSLWAIWPCLVFVIVVVLRTVWEDRILQIELVGYQEYVGRVRFLLIPKVF